jgi:hypothetical protein
MARSRALAQAALEQRAPDRARAALEPLPPDDGDPNPLRIGKTAMLRACLADLNGGAPAAESLLVTAEANLAHLAPEHCSAS